MKKNNIYFMVILTLICAQLLSQNETTQWYFGNKAALDFSSSSPFILNNSAMNTVENSASIADASGNLLFYTSGDTVWNKTHAVMANGAGLFGNMSPSQGVLILKKPLSTTLYYVFTVQGAAGTQGLTYSIVDMSLAAGMGSVTIKNAALYTASCFEQLIAAPHCNGQDYWIISHTYLTNTYRAYLLTASGVNTSPVLTSIGTTGGVLFGAAIKFSPNGKKIGSIVPISFTSATAEVYDFNPSTGVLSNSLSLGTYSNTTSSGTGCEFSPDGTKFYTSSIYQLRQWDLCAGSPAAISTSQYSIATQFTGIMQRAPNGKIYVIANGTSFLNVINSPNLGGSAMNYIALGQSLGTGTCTQGLPNFVSSGIKSPIDFLQGLGCLTGSFTLPGLNACASTGNTVSNVVWNFGDPASGPLNTSTLFNPTHTYPSYGIYPVQIVINYTNCAPDTVRQNIHLVSPTLTVNSPSFSCNGLINASITTIGGSGQYSYTWTPGNMSTQIVTNINPGVYTVSVKDALGNCLNTTTANIGQPSSLSTLITKTLSCTSASALINVSGGSGNYTYSWSPGSYTSSTISGLSPGSYTVVISDTSHNCIITKTISITTLPTPSLTLSGNFTICTGQSTTLQVSGADTYTWSNNSASSITIVSPSVSGVYNVSGSYTANGCSSTKTFSVIVSKCLGVNSVDFPSPVLIYPNPTDNRLTVDTPFDIRLKIYTLYGTLVSEMELKKGQHNINLKDYSSGIYTFEVRSEDKIWRNQIIRE